MPSHRHCVWYASKLQNVLYTIFEMSALQHQSDSKIYANCSHTEKHILPAPLPQRESSRALGRPSLARARSPYSVFLRSALCARPVQGQLPWNSSARPTEFSAIAVSLQCFSAISTLRAVSAVSAAVLLFRLLARAASLPTK